MITCGNFIGDMGTRVTHVFSDHILEEKYSVATGSVLTINTKDQTLCDETGDEELMNISSSFTPQKVEFIRAGGSYAIEFGKKLQMFAASALGVELQSAFAPSGELCHEGQGLTAVEKIFNNNIPII